MKKRISHISFFTSLILSVFLLASVLGCSGGVTPSGSGVSTVNDVDFKVVEVGMGSATVSWNNGSVRNLSFWIVSPNEVSTDFKYKKYWLFEAVDGLHTATVTELPLGEESTLYLCGYNYNDGDYKLLKKIGITATPLANGPVKNLNASFNDSTKLINISWNAISSAAEISKLVLSRKEANDEDYTVLEELEKTKSSYVDSTYDFEKTYFYKVETFDLEGNSCGVVETTEGITTPEMELPVLVTGFTAEQYTDGWDMTWNPQPGAEKYIIGIFSSYYATVPTKTYEVTENHFFYKRDLQVEVDGTYFKVCAVNSKGAGEYNKNNYKYLYIFTTSYTISGTASDITDKTAKVTCNVDCYDGFKVKEATVEYALLNSSTTTDIYKDFQSSSVFELTDLPHSTSKSVYPMMKITYTLMDGTVKTLSKVGSKLTFTTTEPEGYPKKVTGFTYTAYTDGVELTWDSQENVTSYKIYKFESLSSTTPKDEDYIETTENSYFIEKAPDGSIRSYLAVCAVNELGTGGFSEVKSVSSASSPKCEYSVYNQGKTTATVKLIARNSSSLYNTDPITLKKATVQYALSKDISGSPLYCAYQDSNIFDLTGLDFASETQFYGFVKITYTLDGETKTYTLKSYSFDVTTKSFDAPLAPTVASVTRGSATVSFTPLTEEQLCGVDASDVVYRIWAYKQGKSYYETKADTAAGSTASVKVTGLVPNTAYEFTVGAYINGSTIDGDESEKVSATTKAALSKPVINTLEEVAVEGVSKPLSVINVTFDPIAEDEDEEILYGLEWEIFEGSAKTGNYTFNSNNAISDVTSVAAAVNGGNRYFVTLYAYAAEDSAASRVRSDYQEIQLNHVDDTTMKLGLYYKDSAGALAGSILDITNTETWESSTFVPRSTETTYNWGLMSQKGNYVVKFGLNSAMMKLSKSSVYLYYVQKYYSNLTSKISTTTLAPNTTTYFVAPNSECTPLVTFADYTSKTPSTSDPWNMPYYDSTGSLGYSSLDYPSRCGISMTNVEKYMFNNGLYLGIFNSSSNTGSVGVSYRY